MWLALALFATDIGGQDDELLRITMYPVSWAEALTTFERRPVGRGDVRGIGCVGMEMTHMSCGWQQRVRGNWQNYVGWADLSQQDRPILISVELSPGS